MSNEAKPKVSWNIHAGLLARLRDTAKYEQRSLIGVLEQALAKHLAVPLANPDLPEQACELCPACERGVLSHGRCAECNWHRYPRPWRAPGNTRARDTERRAAKARKLRPGGWSSSPTASSTRRPRGRDSPPPDIRLT